jgi:hypothetical protein
MKIGVKGIVFYAVAFAGLVAFMFYYQRQGGFNEVSLEERKDASYTVYGSYFEGSVKSKEFGQRFAKVENVIKRENLNSFAVAYYEKTPSNMNQYKTRVFIGLIPDGDSLDIEGFEYKKISFKASYYAEQNANILGVETYDKLAQVAEDSAVVLDPHRSLEFYYSAKKFGLEIPYHSFNK